jgi:DNA-binding transcriptional regulator YdaS (Cro superfamily)
MGSRMTPREALELAILRAGTQTALAAMIGENIKTGHIYGWLQNGVPAKYAPTIERETGVRCEDLCPGPDWAVLRAANPGRRAQAIREDAKA